MKTTNIRFSFLYLIYILLLLIVAPIRINAQQAYFADGYHGGVFGHYPTWKTQFIIDQLSAHPEWKLGMEIEPETWDTVKVKTPDAYQNFKKLVYDSRLDFTNPTLTQPYCYNISGESLIRQFEYGIKKLHTHFPGLTFTTYAVEEPCFTSCLPQILTSFGFQYAVLKCPNTCWGGYMKEYGGELVNWIGPDNTSILTVPRYECEALEQNSVWQTIAWGNSEEYLQACFDAGIDHPVGMCYQDAGWKNGPWLGSGDNIKNNSRYVTWTEYIRNISNGNTGDNYLLSQDDVRVSLMWGSQALQRIAQQVRTSENKIVQAEKILSMANIEKNLTISPDTLENAWRGLLMAQHHDSWIVPYNRLNEHCTWAEEITLWTDNTNLLTDEIIKKADLALTDLYLSENGSGYINVYNTLPETRKEKVKVALPAELSSKEIALYTTNNKRCNSFKLQEGMETFLVFEVDVPSFGYTTFRLQEEKQEIPQTKSNIHFDTQGNCIVENNQYRITIDPSKGGMIRSLIAKQLNNKEWIDIDNEYGFNEVRGYFYDKNSFISTADTKAVITIVEDNELTQKVKIETLIDIHPCIQTITLTKDQRRIDFSLKIDWKENVGIGEFRQDDSWNKNHRACYDDRYKLHILFPSSLSDAKVYKNAPFDVCKSDQGNTFFNTWDNIKHNVILNWVDVFQEDKRYGMALLSDHTTSYLHGEDYPLGLTAQYSGKGLWNVDYTINQPLDICYAIIPHDNRWDETGLWTESLKWNEPLIATFQPTGKVGERSFIRLNKKGYELTAVTPAENHQLTVRLFNAESDESPVTITLDFPFQSIEEVELNGQTKQTFISQNSASGTSVNLSIPRFGVRTLRITQ